jgi:hypothetical protein
MFLQQMMLASFTVVTLTVATLFAALLSTVDSAALFVVVTLTVATLFAALLQHYLRHCCQLLTAQHYLWLLTVISTVQ